MFFRSKKNKLCDPDSAWKLQNKEQKENALYHYINLKQQGRLIDVFVEEGEEGLERLLRTEIIEFLYNEGNGKTISKVEYLRWKNQIDAKMTDTILVDVGMTDEEIIASHDIRSCRNVQFNEHDACWDIKRRGSVGETALHLAMLFSADNFIFREISKILLNTFPKLALDFYEGDEYYGENGLHIAAVYGDFELVQQLISCGTNINQRAIGRFFLPEDQKIINNKKMTDYNGYAYYGEYPLTFAACFGHENIYDYLIEHDADPNLQDSFGNTVLHMMVIKNQVTLFSYAVRHSLKPADLQITNDQHLTPLTLSSKLGRREIFDKIIELQSYEIWHYGNIKCSVYPLATLDSIGKNGETNDHSALSCIIAGDSDDHLEMLEDGIVKQLLADKWKHFASRRFLERLLVASLHLIILSVAIYLRPDKVVFVPSSPIDTITFVCVTIEICMRV